MNFFDNIVVKKYADFYKKSQLPSYNTTELIQYITEGDQDKTFRCLGQLFREYKDNLKEYKKFITRIWKKIQKQKFTLDEKCKPIVASLHKLYQKMTHKEKPIYLYHAILILVNRQKLLFDPQNYEDLNMNFDAFITKHNKNPVIHKGTKLDDYVYDVHTGDNKTNYERLLKSSFYITPEKFNKKFIEPQYEEIYADIKYALENYMRNNKQNAFLVIPEKNKKMKQSTKNTKVTKTKKRRETPKNKRRKKVKEDWEKKIKQMGSKIETLEKIFKLYKIRPEPIDRKDRKLLNDLPLAQQRTSRYKKYVRIDFDKSRIIKGPYEKTEISFYKAIFWNYALIVLEKSSDSKTAWKWTNIYVDDNDKYYLVTDFVSDNVKNETERNKSLKKTTEKFGKKSNVSFFDRNSCVLGYRILDLIKNKDLQKLLTPTVKQDTVQHLYLRYLLKIGDTGLANMLYVDRRGMEQKVAGIDLEEDRSPKTLNKDTPYKLLFAAKHATYEKVFKDSINQIKFVNWDDEWVSEFSNMFTKKAMDEMRKRDKKIRELIENQKN